MVVHRQAEQDGEQEERQPRLDDGASRKPSTLAPMPSWKTSTRMPYAAPTDSRFSATALSGTTMERKTTSSSRKLNRAQR